MQQVNLYTDVLKPKKVVLSLAHMLVITLALLLIIAGFTFYKRQAVTDVAVMAEKKALQVSSIERDVEVLRAKVARTIRDELLVATNKKLARQLEQRERLVEVLGNSVARGTTGFSVLLVALGQQSIDSLWLTRMYFGQGGRDIGLEGLSSNADSVPVYLKKLRDEPQFVGRSFDLFELQEKDGYLAFYLRSGVVPEEGNVP
jgi:hypothetical protein